jgi:hypothetical protein
MGMDSRVSSVRLDGPRLRHEIARRGITVRAFAGKAGLREETVYAALRQPVRARTAQQIIAALEALPVLELGDLAVGYGS